jgi:hypothetical protein
MFQPDLQLRRLQLRNPYRFAGFNHLLGFANTYALQALSVTRKDLGAIQVA